MKIYKLFAAAAIIFSALAACNSNSGKKIEPITYAGQVSFGYDKTNLTSDTLLTVGKTECEVLDIRRYASSGENFTISLNLYIPKDNDNIAGSIGGYLNRIMNTFCQEECKDKSAGNDAFPAMSAEKVEACADSAVRCFIDVIVPRAKSDSAVGTSVEVAAIPVYIDDSYITYAMYSSTFLGGANAMGDFFLQSYDASTGKPLDFESLIPDNEKRDKIRSELVARIAAKEGMDVRQYLESVSRWNNSAKDNKLTVSTFPIYHVGISDQGYVFCFPKYTIAPGSDGTGVYVVPAV